MNLEKLYSENKGMLHLWAKRYAWLCEDRPHVDAADLAQAGFLGLVEAAQTYDPEKGGWFSWASFYIRNHMKDALGLRTRSGSCKCTSLDAPAYADDDLALLDTIPDDTLPDMEQEVEISDTARIIREAVESLDDEGARLAIVEYYFKNKTLKRIADERGESVNAVRRLHGKGLRRLRQARTIRQLSPEYILDLETRFHAHKGVMSFWSTHTSVVEDAVLLRERIRCNQK